MISMAGGGTPRGAPIYSRRLGTLRKDLNPGFAILFYAAYIESAVYLQQNVGYDYSKAVEFLLLVIEGKLAHKKLIPLSHFVSVQINPAGDSQKG
jgi:hypothetical protein